MLWSSWRKSPNEQQTERGSGANLTQSVRREFDHPMTGLSVEVCSEIKVVPSEKILDSGKVQIQYGLFVLSTSLCYISGCFNEFFKFGSLSFLVPLTNMSTFCVLDLLMQGRRGDFPCLYPGAQRLHLRPVTPSRHRHWPDVWLHHRPTAPNGWHWQAVEKWRLVI